MNKLEEIKEFIQKNTAVMAELAQLAQRDSLYSSYLSDDIIEYQQDLNALIGVGNNAKSKKVNLI